MKIQKFEDLPVWQESIDLGKEIYLLTSIGRFEKDYSFKDQIRRAVLSISSNWKFYPPSQKTVDKCPSSASADFALPKEEKIPRALARGASFLI